jgi:glycosyltransferase involved in cell wall biosynthesis
VETSHDPVVLAEAGISVPPYNPDALHSAILSLNKTPASERAAMGMRGRHYVLEHHNWTHLAKQYASVLHRYIEDE